MDYSLSYEDIAKKLNLQPNTIRHWVKQGKIKYIKLSSKVVRISQEDLDTYLEQFKN